MQLQSPTATGRQAITGSKHHSIASPMAKDVGIKSTLVSLGAVSYDLILPETHALSYVIQSNEKIQGIVYGRYRQIQEELVGRGALVATDHRVVLVDKKPGYVKVDEVIYDAISGVTYSRVWLMGIVTLHSKIGDIKLRTFNQKCARYFVAAVEKNILLYRRSYRHDYS